MPKAKQTFGVQAARFSLYAPLAVVVINLCTYGNRSELFVTTAITVINLSLIVAGLVLGIVALASIRRYGRAGILGRALFGVVLNGIVVIALVGLFLPAIRVGQMKNKLVGRWELQTNPGSKLGNADISFSQDGTFHFVGKQQSTPISIEGRWVLTPKRVIGVTIDRVIQGQASAVGKKMALGEVKNIDGRHLALQTDNGVESYDRVP